MSEPPPPRTPPLPRRVVVGGYSLDPDGDGTGTGPGTPTEPGPGLSVLDLDRDAADGHRYVTVGHLPLASPTWVVQHPRHPWLVSVSETTPSELVCTRLDADGGLAVLGRRPTGGDGGCHLALSADGRQVLVAHYGSGTVESFALDDDGQVSAPLDRFTSRAPLGPDPDRQDAPHAHQVVLDPDRPGEVLVCDLGTDRVHRLRLHGDGRLTEEAAPLVLPPGSGPRHLVVAGDTLVVAGELSGELWLGRRDENGWSPTQVVPTTRRTPGERSLAGAAAHPSGVRVAAGRVFVATRGIDTVSVFGLDEARSTVAQLGEASCGGQHPRDLVVADGLLWVANQWSDEVVALDLAALDPAAPGAGRDAVVARLGVPRPARVVLLDGHGEG